MEKKSILGLGILTALLIIGGVLGYQMYINMQTESDNGKSLVEDAEPAQIIDVEDSTSIRVLWTVSGYVLSRNFTGDEEEAGELLFHHLDMGNDYITFSGKQCIGVVFDRQNVNIAEYVSNEWGETPKSLRIENHEMATEVRTNCNLFGFNAYLQLSSGDLIVPYNEVFYSFEPFVFY
jgi:hypothetical protein